MICFRKIFCACVRQRLDIQAPLQVFHPGHQVTDLDYFKWFSMEEGLQRVQVLPENVEDSPAVASPMILSSSQFPSSVSNPISSQRKRRQHIRLRVC